MQPLVVERSTQIDAPARRVWESITFPGSLEQWMLVTPAFEGAEPLQRGSNIPWKNEAGDTYLTGTVTVCEPGRRLVIAMQDVSWDKTGAEVTYSLALTEQQGATLIQLRFGDLSVDPEGQAWFAAYNSDRELAAIKAIAERSDS